MAVSLLNADSQEFRCVGNLLAHNGPSQGGGGADG